MAYPAASRWRCSAGRMPWTSVPATKRGEGVEFAGPAEAGGPGRARGVDARAGGGEEAAGGKIAAMRWEELGKALRAGLFAGFDQELDVEPQAAAALGCYRLQGGD